VLGGLLFLWQIPHFLSLSFPLKEDYARAGYKMLSVTNVDAYVHSQTPTPLYRQPRAVSKQES
jgi:heme O synthase-like polyprenyltransferase